MWRLLPASTPRCLLWPPTHPSVRSGSGSLGRAPRLASNPAQSRCHPSPGPKKSLQQTWQIQICIQLGKVNAQAGRAYLDFIKLRRLGIFQSLGIMRRKTYIEPRTELDNDPPGGPVISRRNRLRKRRPHSLPSSVRKFEIVIPCHECSPTRRTAIPHDSLELARYARSPAAKIRSFPEPRQTRPDNAS